MNQHFTSIIIIIALVLFSIYRRVRRNIGWQQLKHGNLMFRTVLFLIIGLVFFAGGIFHPISFISDLAGILIGFILAYYGASMTQFENRKGDWHYRPNTWIGSIVTVIFLARFFYRFYGVFAQGGLSAYQQGQQAGNLQSISSVFGNSWSAGLMLIMFAYYIIYYIFLIRKQKQLVQADTTE